MQMRNVCNIFFGKPEIKNSLGRHRLRWEDNIKVDLVGSVNWIYRPKTGSNGGHL
jgi:hypothetical protein